MRRPPLRLAPWCAVLFLGACGPRQATEPRRAQADPPPARPAPRAADGEPCSTTAGCVKGLTCQDGRCLDPSCPWSLTCLKKLQQSYGRSTEGYEVSRWLRKLTAKPIRADCRGMPKRIAFLLSNQPWRWKRLCGAPPVPGVKRRVAKDAPFRIRDQQIKAGNVPTDETKEVHARHLALPDLCKVWVDFELTRPYQTYKTGRFCQGIDKRKLSLEAEEDPFLFHDELARPKPRPRRPAATFATPSDLAKIKLGVAPCDAYVRIFRCYVQKLPAAAHAAVLAAFQKTVLQWQLALVGAKGKPKRRAASAKGCRTAVRTFSKVLKRIPPYRSCLSKPVRSR